MMKDTPSHLKTLEEIERTSIAALVEVLRRRALTPSGTSSGTRPAGTATTAHPPGATALLRSRSASGGRWRYA